MLAQMKVYFPLLYDAYEHIKMLLNVNRNAKIIIESELRANVCFLALMNASLRYWSPIHANECVFSRSEQQKMHLHKMRRRNRIPIEHSERIVRAFEDKAEVTC